MSSVCRETLLLRAGMALLCAGTLLPASALAQADTSAPADPPADAAPAAEPAAEPAPAPADASASAAAPQAPAETAAETVPTIPVKDGAPAVVPAKDSTQLDAVVVTARKRVETIQEVPLSVTAFSGKEMDRRGFSGLEDIARATPGFTFEPYMTGGAHAAPVIRGLAQTFTTARIQNVSFFLDGVYLQRQSMLDLGMVDMERIEVMKGPQNALYGRNAFAGAVNYITLEPGSHNEGYLSAGIGDNNRRDYRVSLTGPFDEAGYWRGKFTAGMSTYDGHTHNNHPVADANPPGENLRGNLGGHDDKTYAMSLAYVPDDGPKVRGSYYWSDLVHETSPGYSISGLHAARFDLRLDNQNDLNCLTGTIDDIGNPGGRNPAAGTHTGFSAYCGELPKYASDIAARKVKGMVVDPRAIGTLTKTGLGTLSVDYSLTPDLGAHYMLGAAKHNSYTDGGASDEDPALGRGIYVDASKDNQDTTAYVYANTASGRPNSELKEMSHELRLDWKAMDALTVIGGAYYSHVKDQEWTTLFISDLCNADSVENIAHCNEPISASNHIAEQTVLTTGAAYDQYVRQAGGHKRGEWTAFDDSIMAVFASGTYDITPSLKTTLDLRFSRESKAIDRLTDAQMLAPGESVKYAPPADPVIPGLADTVTSLIKVPHDSTSYTDIAPRAIVNWDWDEGHMLYGSVAKGTKAGGFNNSTDPGEATYKPETNWTYEIGSKNVFFHHAITVNGAVYYIKWDNLQGNAPPASGTLGASDFVVNLGGAKSLGAEISSMVALSQAFSFDASASYTDPKYDAGVIYQPAVNPLPANSSRTATKIFCDDVRCRRDGDVGGNQLARTSKIQASLGLNYIAYLGDYTLTSRLDTNYQSKQYVEPVNLAWVPQRLVSNASLKLNLPDWHWEINSWVKNLTNEDYAANSFYIGVFDQYMVGKGTPRTYGATLKYKF